MMNAYDLNEIFKMLTLRSTKKIFVQNEKIDFAYGVTLFIQK